MTVNQVLSKVLAKIEQGWCQKVPARRYGGFTVKPTDLRACEWCLIGAVRSAVYEPGEPDLSLDAYQLAIDVHNRLAVALDNPIWDVPKFVLQDWNDSDDRTRGDVLRLIRKAIEEAE